MKNQPANPPTVSQPNMPTNTQLFKINRNYLFSLTGILRVAIVIFQFAAFVSAASVPKIIQGQYFMPQAFADTRSAYLFFSIVGCILALIVYLIFLLNLVHARFLDRAPWSLILLVTDGIWMITTLVLAIVCAVREASLKTDFSNYLYATNIGAFGSAAFFGFLLAVIYGIDAAYYLIRIIRGGVYTPPTTES